MTLFGVAVTARTPRTEAEEVAYLETTLGRRVDLRYSFSSSLPASYATAPFRTDSDRSPMWSFKMDPAAAIAQEPGGAWTTFLDTVPERDEPYRFIYYQEPGGDLPPAIFRAAFHRLHELAWQARSDIRMGANLSSWDFDPANPSAEGPRYIPPAAEFVGLSLFANKADPGVNKDALGRAYEAVHEYGIPFALSSVGVSSEQTQSRVEVWLRHLADLANGRAAHGDPLDHIVCYSSNIAPANWTVNEWWLDGAAWTTQAWRDLIDVARGDL